MWQVSTLPQGKKFVSGVLSEGMTIVFMRVGDAPVFLSIGSNEAEPRIFDKVRLPIITVDGEHVFDLNKEMEYQKTTNQNWCFSKDRLAAARIWGGQDKILVPSWTIAKILMGSNLHVRVFFDPFAMAEYSMSLIGLADAFQQVFGVTIGQATTGEAFGVAEGSISATPDLTIDRAAIRSMVEDFWRSFISVAANPKIGAQIIDNFDERIQATASSMVPVKAQIFLQAVGEERDLLFEEYKRNPDALKRRLGLASINQLSLMSNRNQRQSIGEMAVRTAVRATIWETVISLFRGFR